MFCLVFSAHGHGGMETQRRTLARACKVPIFCRIRTQNLHDQI
ncbi:hypothetical protein NC652_023435 [Populus alba x Populus x berolinensis]|nr:hypothetical protein NC652_023435 [Populus alba x Populus x berolinensis]